MRLYLAVLLGKLIAYFIKLLKIGGASAAPGLYALKIDPSLVQKLSKPIPKNIVITGTNGKTTTSKMLAHFAKASGLKVIRNHTGSNLERGIASTLISHCTLDLLESERPRSRRPMPCTLNLGIWELDEAAFNTTAPKLKPDIIVFLNIFRDQLDRYGEIDTVVKNWRQTVQKLEQETAILINGDDANLLKLAGSFKGKIQKFGVKDYKIAGEGIEHLKETENLDFEAQNVKLDGLKRALFELKIVNCKLKIELPLPGLYHIYDFIASFAAGTYLGFQPKQMVLSLKNYSPVFGRVERLPFGYIFLIKNPAGATQVFETIAPNIKPEDRLLLALNDNIADGKDVSWIWDIGLENVKSQISNVKCFISGTRAYDLAVRLKYTGVDPKQIIIEPDLDKALKEARKGLKGQLFILPTYTAMMELQSILTKAGIKKHYWEAE